MELLWLFIGIVIGLLGAWFYLNGQYHKRFEARQGELLQQVRDADERAEAAQEVNRTTQVYLAELEAKKISTAERIGVLDNELKMIRDQRQLERAELESVKQQLAEAHAARDAATGQIETLKSDLANAGSELEIARTADADRAARLEALEAAGGDMQARLDEARAHNEARQARIDELQGILRQRDETISRLEAELAASPPQSAPSATGSAQVPEPEIEDDQAEPAGSGWSASAEPKSAEAMSDEALSDEPGGRFGAAAMPEAGHEPGGDAAQGDRADNLTKIKGIGKVLRGKLNQLGITTFRQIAEFTEADIERVNAELDFPGRIEREQWIEQARSLMSD